MTRYVSDTKAGKSISAYVILNKKGDWVATVKAHFSDGGKCLVNVHDKTGSQSATATGCGYDKFTSALSDLTIDGHKMTDHCSREGAPKPPKGRKLFSHAAKPPKGYEFANYEVISLANGGYSLGRDHWINKAYVALGIANESVEVKQAHHDDLIDKAQELECEWRKSNDCEVGYSDCYRKSGLEYLTAIGYRVIQAI